MSSVLTFSLQLRAWASIGAFGLLVLQSHLPEEPYLSCRSGLASEGSKYIGSGSGLSGSALGSSGLLGGGGVGGGTGAGGLDLGNGISGVGGSLGSNLAQITPPGITRSYQEQESSGRLGSGAAADGPPLTGPLPKLVKVFGAKTEGAFAVFAAPDDDSVRRAIGTDESLACEPEQLSHAYSSPVAL